MGLGAAHTGALCDAARACPAGPMRYAYAQQGRRTIQLHDLMRDSDMVCACHVCARLWSGGYGDRVGLQSLGRWCAVYAPRQPALTLRSSRIRVFGVVSLVAPMDFTPVPAGTLPAL